MPKLFNNFKTKDLTTRENIMWNAFGSLVFLGCQWLITVFAARLSNGYSDAGVLAICMSIANIYAQVGLFKIRSYQVSDLTCEYSASEYICFRLISMAMGLSFVLLYAVFTCSLSTAFSVFLYCFYKSFEVFIDVLHGIDQKSRRMDLCGISMFVRGVLSIAAFTLGFASLKSLNASFLLMILVNVPILLLDWYGAFSVCNAGEFHFAISASRWRNLFVECLPSAIGVVCCSAVTTVSRQLLDYMSGSEILGIYASVCTPAVIVQAGASFVYAPLLGDYAAYLHNGDFKKIRKSFVASVACFLSITGVSLVFSYLFGDWFLRTVFGSSISGYTDLLYLALVSAVSTALIGYLTDLSIVFRNMRASLICNLIPLLIVGPLTIWFVSLFGPNGVSIAIIISFIIGSIALCISLANTIKRLTRNSTTTGK